MRHDLALPSRRYEHELDRPIELDSVRERDQRAVVEKCGRERREPVAVEAGVACQVALGDPAGLAQGRAEALDAYAVGESAEHRSLRRETPIHEQQTASRCFAEQGVGDGRIDRRLLEIEAQTQWAVNKWPM